MRIHRHHPLTLALQPLLQRKQKPNAAFLVAAPHTGLPVATQWAHGAHSRQKIVSCAQVHIAAKWIGGTRSHPLLQIQTLLQKANVA
jgi:hypothetical protein